MTVAELIAELQKMPQDALVKYTVVEAADPDGEYPVDLVRLAEDGWVELR